MRLSKIKLSGFKTFVEPTTLTLPSNLVGIVGPNGCGKSNVIDAVRWVLGESSAKYLRGESMYVVIFNGSALVLAGGFGFFDFICFSYGLSSEAAISVRTHHCSHISRAYQYTLISCPSGLLTSLFFLVFWVMFNGFAMVLAGVFGFFAFVCLSYGLRSEAP